MPLLTFLGAARTVTGSKYLLEVDRHRILVDCGLFQGLKELRLRNWEPLPVAADEVHAVVLTHAHVDHSGYLPRLFAQGFRGRVFCTPGTADLCRIVLPDAGRLAEEDARAANREGYTRHSPALPLFTEADALSVLAQIERDAGNTTTAVEAATKAYRLAWCDGEPYAYHWGLDAARKHLRELGAPEPDMPPFDESKYEPMPEVEINPHDEFYVDET